MISSPGCSADTRRWAAQRFSWLHHHKKAIKRFSIIWTASDSKWLARTWLYCCYVQLMFWCLFWTAIISHLWPEEAYHLSNVKVLVCTQHVSCNLLIQKEGLGLGLGTTMKSNQLCYQRQDGQIYHTTMMSSCSLRLRIASCRSATAPRRSSKVVLPSFTTFSAGKSLAVAQRSKCLYLVTQ